MAIFTNRILQKIINDNSKFLTAEQLRHHVNALNRADQETIDFEWEIVILNAFSKIGDVIHEPDFGGSSRVDMQFTGNGNSSTEFIADIATVSDRGLEKQNRMEDFSREFNRLLKKHQLAQERFSWSIAGEHNGRYRDNTMKLKLPENVNWAEVFDDGFFKFIHEVKENEDKQHSFAKNTEIISYSIGYNPSQKGQSGHYPCYKVAYSLTKNPVYKVLKRKAEQLRKANYNGLKAIILCDGGCSLLNDTRRGIDNFNLDQVVNGFLRNNSSISFVLTFATEEVQMMPMFQRKIQFRIAPRFIPNSFHYKDEIATVFKIIEPLPSYFPSPTTTANNAQRFVEYYRQKGRSFEGGLEMSAKRIKMSSRALLELLAGQTSAEEFFKTQHLFSFNESLETNLFRLRALEGCMFNKIYIEKQEDRDDDWIIFEFGDPDPAVSPFRVPQD